MGIRKDGSSSAALAPLFLRQYTVFGADEQSQLVYRLQGGKI